jgi:O-antigen/teichoic acid export membrane protein
MSVLSIAAQRARHAFKSNFVLLFNSGAQVLTAFLTAIFGLAFWWVAARHFPTHSVGLASAAISMMNLIGMISEFGLGTLLIGQSLHYGIRAPGLISAALLAAPVSAMLAASGFLILARRTGLSLGSFLGRDYATLFIAGCAITCFSQVIDSALVGLLRSAVAMYRNVAFATLKLAFLLAAACIRQGDEQETIIFFTWVLGILGSIAFLGLVLRLQGRRIWFSPNFRMLQTLTTTVLSHHLLNLITQGPTLLLPFLVTIVFTADVNAAFYAAWMILNVALLVPYALTNTLFTIGSVEPETIAVRFRFSLLLCTTTSIATTASCFLLSGPILSCFGPSYVASGRPILQILAWAAPAATIKYHFIALQRLNGHMAFASLILGVGGVIELASAILWRAVGGLDGFTSGWVAAVYLEAAFVTPAILKVVAPKRPLFDTAPSQVKLGGQEKETPIQSCPKYPWMRQFVVHSSSTPVQSSQSKGLCDSDRKISDGGHDISTTAR